MKENQLLNNTLEVLDKKGVENAYDYIVKKREEFDMSSSQIYNYMYCLAAVCGKIEEALLWMEEAIIKKGYWYRPDVFEDSDLDSIRDDKRYDVCRLVSEKRYLEAEKKAKTVCTWEKVSSKQILLAVHGNQENIQMCKENWDYLKEQGYQVEYIQSREVDSYQLYRWDDDGDGDEQLEKVISSIDWNIYKNHVLCGFSAGCNVILKGLAKYSFICESIILQSPWIPVINQNLNEILTTLKKRQINVLVICGESDEDCRSLTEIFVKKAIDYGVKIKEVWIKGLSHEFPDNFEEIVNQFLGIDKM